jgi:hypothetical protein
MHATLSSTVRPYPLGCRAVQLLPGHQLPEGVLQQGKLFLIPRVRGTLYGETGDWVIMYPDGGLDLLPDDIYRIRFRV